MKTKKFNKRAEDSQVLPLIKLILEERPTYGYKRITAMINKRFTENLNKKRIYRLMRKEGLLLQRNQINRAHTGTGTVAVIKSNIRWCSDCFEIHCWNDERVHVAFSLDCCDREAIDFISSKNDILARDIQSLMITSVESRFGCTKTPRPIQWLSDRGPVFRANETQLVAKSLGLKPCFTAAYSPSSNGMAEAFVATFKRDYVYSNDCISAAWVLGKLPEWFKDYNEIAPHSALAMRSPKEYQKAVSGVG